MKKNHRQSMCFFPLVFNITDRPWVAWFPELEDHECWNIALCNFLKKGSGEGGAELFSLVSSSKLH